MEQSIISVRVDNQDKKDLNTFVVIQVGMFQLQLIESIHEIID